MCMRLVSTTAALLLDRERLGGVVSSIGGEVGSVETLLFRGCRSWRIPWSLFLSEVVTIGRGALKGYPTFGDFRGLRGRSCDPPVLKVVSVRSRSIKRSFPRFLFWLLGMTQVCSFGNEVVPV